MTLNTVTVICNYTDGLGNPVTRGTLRLYPTTEVLDSTTSHLVITQAPIIINLAVNPTPSVDLIATDSDGLLPPGWGWVFAPVFPGAPAAQQLLVPFADGATQYLSDLLPVSTAPAVTGGTIGGPLILAGNPPLKLPAGTDGDVLTSDAAGNLTLAAPSGGGGGGGSLPLTTAGDMLYENSTPAPARLQGNTSAVRKFLTQTGDGTNSAPPAWGRSRAGTCLPRRSRPAAIRTRMSPLPRTGA